MPAAEVKAGLMPVRSPWEVRQRAGRVGAGTSAWSLPFSGLINHLLSQVRGPPFSPGVESPEVFVLQNYPALEKIRRESL